MHGSLFIIAKAGDPDPFQGFALELFLEGNEMLNVCKALILKSVIGATVLLMSTVQTQSCFISQSVSLSTFQILMALFKGYNYRLKFCISFVLINRIQLV